MKFLHLADLHLGKRVNGFDLLEDQRTILEQVLALCDKHKAEAVVLRGNLHTAADEVHDGLVAAAVAELELFHLGAAGEADHLVPQADAEQRHAADELAHLGVGLLHGIRVARAVGQKDAVGVARQDLLGRGIPRHDRELAARAHEALEDAALDAAVVHRHAVARLGGRGGGEVVGGRQVGGGVGMRLGAAHRAHEVLAHERGRRIEQLDELGDAEDLGGDDALLGTVIAQMAHEGTRVDALDAHDAHLLQIVGHRDLAAPVGRGGAHVVHDDSAQRRGVRPPFGAAREGALDVGGVDAVVADLGVGHGHDLPCVRGVREDLEIALERGVEAHLPRRRAGRAAGTPIKNGPVLQHEDRGTVVTLACLCDDALSQLARRCLLDFDAHGGGVLHLLSFSVSRYRFKGRMA